MVFFPWATIVFAAAAAAWTSPIFAAFDAVVPPLATLVITLLPAFIPPVLLILAVFGVCVVPSALTNCIPSLVTLNPPVASFTTKPELSSLLFPVVTLSILIFLANLTVSVSVPLETTPILLSASFVVSVTPPTIFEVSPIFLAKLFPVVTEFVVLTSPSYLRFVAFNWATVTASVSSAPSAKF